ncbi:MAG: SDR family NAD(P)-dependent oxidoreductase [Acidimicrobiia bacterium]|nr:SDR family NAD(P)-dependent oxidoreductase [Acidimicrobiia bacterium]
MTAWTIAGRAVAITGASGGIGGASAVELARGGARLILVGRNPERHRLVRTKIEAVGGEAILIEADFTSLPAVAEAGRRLAEESPSVLINNAATAGRRGVTENGFEVTFAVNHLAHFLLTRLVLEKMAAHPPGRILTVSSNAHLGIGSFDWQAGQGTTRSLTGMREYRHSKAANVAFTLELSRRLAGTELTAAAIHPGLVATGLWWRIPRPFRHLALRRMVGPEQGARVVVHCATTPELIPGGYYTPSGLRPPADYVSDPETNIAFWERSEQLVAAWL